MQNFVKILLAATGGLLVLAGLWYALNVSHTFSIEGNRPVETTRERGAEDEPQVSPARVTLLAVGDVMLSRNVEQKMLARNDWNYPFEKTQALTSQVDLTFGNLETTILEGKIVKSGSFLFRTDPQAVAGLKYAGFDVLSLANNHMLNYGRGGIESTLRELDAAGIAHAGAGLSEASAQAPVVREVKGMRFGFLAYTYAKEGGKGEDGQRYGTDDMETERMKREVAALKREVDVVVVSMHAGTEYETGPSAFQREFARAAVEAGASLVIGHHPHVVQTAERYKDGYILYSLGNFVFDQMWSEETRLGAVAKITFEDKKIKGIEFVPVKIYDYAQPQLLEGEQARMITARLKLAEG